MNNSSNSPSKIPLLATLATLAGPASISSAEAAPPTIEELEAQWNMSQIESAIDFISRRCIEISRDPDAFSSLDAGYNPHDYISRTSMARNSGSSLDSSSSRDECRLGDIQENHKAGMEYAFDAFPFGRRNGDFSDELAAEVRYDDGVKVCEPGTRFGREVKRCEEKSVVSMSMKRGKRPSRDWTKSDISVERTYRSGQQAPSCAIINDTGKSTPIDCNDFDNLARRVRSIVRQLLQR